MSNLSQLSKSQQLQQQQQQQQQQQAQQEQPQSQSPTLCSSSSTSIQDDEVSDIVLINSSPSGSQIYDITNSPGTYPLPQAIALKSPSPLRLPERQPTPPPLQLEGTAKRCWICLGDETDSEGVWVKPCFCSLSSHEHCLLSWIKENQKDNPTKKVQCPQCNSTYQFAEPSSLIVDLFSKVDNFLLSAVPYFSIFGLTCSILITSTTYGAYAVLTICGVEEGERILGSPDPWGWRVWVGLPLIPFILISSRTTYLDHLMPLLPALFIKNDQIEFSFPPSPALSVSLLPWVRLVYNFSFNHFFGDIETRWREHFRNFNTNATFTVGDGNAQDDDNVQDQEAEGDLFGNNEANMVMRGGQYRFNFFRDLVRPIVGALFVPAICSFSGYILYQIPFLRSRLTEPFHRNVLGGCLFIVLKDLLSLFYKYQLLKRYRTRHVRSVRDD